MRGALLWESPAMHTNLGRGISSDGMYFQNICPHTTVRTLKYYCYHSATITGTAPTAAPDTAY